MEVDTIVVGSGPAGVSAAYELLAAGRDVTMLEAGTEPDNEPSAGSLGPVRTDSHGLVRSRNTSPKLRSAKATRMLAEYQSAYDVRSDDFELMGSLAVGGLSNVWGAGVAEWTTEIDAWPAAARSTRDWYPRIARRMGLSGPGQDALTPHISPTISMEAPVPVTAPSRGLLERAHQKQTRTFLLGGVRQAVLTADRDGRHACDLTGLCLTGCPREAIYSSRFDVRILSASPSFRLRTGSLVAAVGQEGGQVFADIVFASGEHERVHGRRVFVAAGAPASTALASRLLPDDLPSVAIESTPVLAFALAPLLSLPRRCSGGYAQAQGAHLSWPGVPPLSSDECLFGYLFNAGSLPVSELLDRLPQAVSRMGGPLWRSIWSRLVLVTAFLPGRLTQNTLTIERRDPARPPAIRVHGRVDPALGPAMPALRRFYRGRFARLGWLLLPGSFQQAPVGSDVHYGASMPMSDSPETSPSPLATDTLGRLPQAQRVHFVDGAVLPGLPGKPHTFTVMANAARIAASAARLDG